ncbi:MAG: hypothetical protein HC878_00235 [Leptolyngbyaceae cyanobacterium SL_5_14]|nr:hypothetical protein [Leptolyngbyaceae cyanobacterium SL_5_14]
MSDIERYQETLHPQPMPSGLLQAIARQQELKQRELALREAEILLSINTASEKLPEVPTSARPEPEWMVIVAQKLQVGIWFLVACCALLLLHLATVRSLNPETTTYHEQAK